MSVVDINDLICDSLDKSLHDLNCQFDQLIQSLSLQRRNDFAYAVIFEILASEVSGQDSSSILHALKFKLSAVLDENPGHFLSLQHFFGEDAVAKYRIGSNEFDR
jgi:hypothetical protein